MHYKVFERRFRNVLNIHLYFALHQSNLYQYWYLPKVPKFMVFGEKKILFIFNIFQF